MPLGCCRQGGVASTRAPGPSGWGRVRPDTVPPRRSRRPTSRTDRLPPLSPPAGAGDNHLSHPSVRLSRTAAPFTLRSGADTPGLAGCPAEYALRHQRRFGGGPGLIDLRAHLVHRRVVGRGERRQFGKVAGQPQVPGRRCRLRPVSQSCGAAGQSGERGRQHRVRRGLEVGGIAVVPAAVEPPHVADYELRLVVDRLEVRFGGQVGERPDSVDDLVEPRAGVHQRERLLDQRLQIGGGAGQRLTDALGADDGRAVAGQQLISLSRSHLPQRGRPFGGVTLHLLRIPGVGGHPHEQVAGARDTTVSPAKTGPEPARLRPGAAAVLRPADAGKDAPVASSGGMTTAGTGDAEKAKELMSRESGLGDLIRRSKEGAVPALELRKVAGILAAGPGGNDTYQLLYVLVRSGAREYEDLVAGLLGYQDDPMVARLALQALRTVWGLAGRYDDTLARFLQGVDRDRLERPGRSRSPRPGVLAAGR